MEMFLKLCFISSVSLGIVLKTSVFNVINYKHAVKVFDFPTNSCLEFNAVRNGLHCFSKCLKTSQRFYMFSHHVLRRRCMCCVDSPGSVLNDSSWKSYKPPLCPSTYAMYNYTHYNICLRYISISANYTEAVGNCQADGGDLVKIDSSHKYDIFKDHIGRFAADDSSQMWVQGVEINDRWIFHDGTLMPNICPLFESNASGEIHLTSYVYYNFSCYDSSPSSEHHYVCEIYRVFP